VGFSNVFCVLFYGDFPNFCPCLNGRDCKMLISGQCWLHAHCSSRYGAVNCTIHCHSSSVNGFQFYTPDTFVFIFQAFVICFFQLMLNPLGISLDPSRSRLQMTTDITRQIYIRDGVRGFYRGYVASLCTYVPNSALWWAFYDLYQGNY
jgi:hypothetical protein